MASILGFRVPPFLVMNSENKPQSRVRFRSLAKGDSVVLSSDSVVADGASVVGEKERTGFSSDNGNGRLIAEVEKQKKIDSNVPKNLEPLWDDGYGTSTVKDYFHAVKEIIKPDDGPPRWFSPIECGRPVKDAPVLLFLPGNLCLTMDEKFSTRF